MLYSFTLIRLNKNSGKVLDLTSGNNRDKITYMDFGNYPVTIGLIIANVIFSFIGFSNTDLVNKTIMWPYRVARENQYIRFITSGFLHADYMHLIFNMFTLFFFGRNLEIYFTIYGLGGKISYLLLYFLGLIISDIPSYIKHKDDYNYRSLGASGAVSAVIFATIIFSPWTSIYIYGAIKISAAVYAVLYILYCVYMGKRNVDNVNHDAHLWGSLFGLAFTLALIGFLNPTLFTGIIEQLKHPSLFGNG